MKYAPSYAKAFKKQIKKLSQSDKQSVYAIIERLSNGETLEPRYKNHKLKGEYEGYEECHIKPDLLLIYQKYDDILLPIC